MIAERKPRYYKVGDLFVYAAIALIVAALVCSLVFGRSKSFSGISVESKGACVYTYRFGSGGKIENAALVKEREGNGRVTVTVYADEKKAGYNVIVIDPKEKTAVVREADCSYSKACTHMKGVSAHGGVIVCVPHALVVRSLDEKPVFEPSVG